MKKLIALSSFLAVTAVTISGCSDTKMKTIEFALWDEGQAKGFDKMIEEFSKDKD